ncbi:MAG: cbb3-type cytochrome c oxidase subunit 3 [Verrucomicrobia bacterium]|nr:cbb3-type cytochrome c oxidase subunit 3 [Kiritimatiellia bacterium]MCB1100977.1 cbb3-type cytochrome c oxidase subunit 3 [Kiritimatiellia bacterium]MCP5487013.1 cbb3-type cytochrome c oxidase subunit 3 [Verrucomicrobiota bacterium]
MIRNVLESIGGITIYPVIGLILFVGVFAGMTLWALRLRRPYIDHMGHLPLEEDRNDLPKENHR